jgi:protein-S-isoprenylcysteine O-methyltransferase Ste14
MRADQVWGFVGAAISLALACESLVDYTASASFLAVLYFSVHAVTAWFFLIRRPQVARPRRLLPDAVAVASLLSPYAYDASRLETAGPAAGILLASATLCLLISTVSLGRSFAILPAVREVRTGLAYRVVRHPVYASYLLMDVALLASGPTTWNVSIMLLAAALLIVRIRFEEQLLDTDQVYLAYRRRVRYRLIPHVI